MQNLLTSVKYVPQDNELPDKAVNDKSAKRDGVEKKPSAIKTSVCEQSEEDNLYHPLHGPFETD